MFRPVLTLQFSAEFVDGVATTGDATALSDFNGAESYDDASANFVE